MQAIIADDEAELRDGLQRMLYRLWPELDIIAQANNGIQALENIEAYKPDIAFLDIRMPGLTGLEVANKVADSTRVVFITSHDNYAVEAFEKNAIDYLLKPIKEARLQQTINKVKARDGHYDRESFGEAMASIRASLLEREPEPLKWIKALKGDVVHMVHAEDIAYFFADNKYTSAHTTEGEFVIRTALNKLEEMLDEASFWRIHRGTIVNVNYIQSAKKRFDGRYTISLKQLEKKLDVSRTYAHLFKQM